MKLDEREQRVGGLGLESVEHARVLAQAPGRPQQGIVYRMDENGFTRTPGNRSEG